MTLRERMLKTLKHGVADMVPCCPDISIMVPIKLKNKPFWEFSIDKESNVYNEANIKVAKAYVDACAYFGTVAWAIYVQPTINQEEVKYESKILEKSNNRIITQTKMITPEGNLYSETVHFIDRPSVETRKFIKDFKKEFNFLKYFYPPLDNINFEKVLEEKKYVGEYGVNSVMTLPPSLVHLDMIVDGGLGKLGLIYYDHPELILKYKEMHEQWSMQYLKKIIEAKCCDEILTGGSGLMTWQSPKITRDLSLDGLKQITKMCKENSLISHLHCCGFEKELVKMCAEETDLDVIEPLEPPPQGDCDLKELKEKYGNKLVFKGNLHTSRVMLADVKTVEAEAIKCIEDAAEGGGFILSTGDQCGRDTPHENIFKLVEVCEKYGNYKNI